MLTPDPLKRIKFHEIHLHSYMRRRREINDEVFEKLIQIPSVNVKGISQNEIQKSIRKRKDKSFVVIYDLLFGQMGIESSTPIIIQLMERQSFENILLSEIQKPAPYDYGKELPKDIVAIVLSILGQINYQCYSYLFRKKFNIVIKIKSPDYKLKCYHKNLIKMTKYNSSVELFNEFQKEEEEAGSKNDLACINFKEENNNKKPKTKENKYSPKEIIFNIQIYKMPTNNNDHMIEFQLCRRHPVVFMDFCNKVIVLLNQHFNQF